MKKTTSNKIESIDEAMIELLRLKDFFSENNNAALAAHLVDMTMLEMITKTSNKQTAKQSVSMQSQAN